MPKVIDLEDLISREIKVGILRGQHEILCGGSESSYADLISFNYRHTPPAQLPAFERECRKQEKKLSLMALHPTNL
jgi:hypothetical protein